MADITQLIEEDHTEQRRLFALLEEVDDRDATALGAIWGRLAALLDSHAEAEERYFYPDLLALGRGADDKPTSAAETEDAIGDHNKIRDAVEEVRGLHPGTPAWRSAVSRANHANSDHMAEEERQGLADFRRHAPLSLRHEIGIKFAAFQAGHLTGAKAVDKDPHRYVAQHTPASVRAHGKSEHQRS